MTSSTSNSNAFCAAFGATLAIFSAAFFGGTEALIRTNVVPNHNEYKYLELFRTSTSPDAIFGDSHAAYSLTGLPGFVNLAYGGNNFASISGKVRLYFAKRTPRRVILQAGPHHFSRDFMTFRPDDASAFQTSMNGHAWLKPLMFEFVHRKELFGYWREFLSGGSFVPQLRFQADGSRLSDDRYDMVPAEVRSTQAARTVRILEPVAGFASSSVAQGYRATINFLRSKGATVCLVTFPVASYLREEIRKHPAYAEATSFFEGLARESSIRYVNLGKVPLPDALFADAHHVNAEGARRISQDIIERCFN